MRITCIEIRELITSRSVCRLRLLERNLLCLSSLLISALSYLSKSSSREALLSMSMPEKMTPIMTIGGMDLRGTRLGQGYVRSWAI